MELKIRPFGKFVVELIRDGKVLQTLHGHNDVTNEGKDELLKTMFSLESSPVTAWYIGLIAGASATEAAADTMASHAGWAEILAAKVDETERQAWIGSDVVADQELTNVVAVEYNINDPSGQTIRGIFVTSDNVLNATDGVLWATGLFSSVINANDNDKIRLTYTIGVE